MIVGILGYIGEGKGTIGDILVEEYGFKQMSFASKLKDIVAIIFNWDRKMLEGDTKESREWRDQVDHYWADKLGMPGLTPRWVLQYWGTEVCRVGFHDDIWILALQAELENYEGENIVITDSRFPNEAKMIIEQSNGMLIDVTRPGVSDYRLGLVTNMYDAKGLAERTRQEFENGVGPELHISETAIAVCKHQYKDVSYKIVNDGSLVDLQRKVGGMIGALDFPFTSLDKDVMERVSNLSYE